MIKQRNIALCIVFSIITFGIYALYWFVCLTNDEPAGIRTAAIQPAGI